jgi:hypothetical protein
VSEIYQNSVRALPVLTVQTVSAAVSSGPLLGGPLTPLTSTQIGIWGTDVNEARERLQPRISAGAPSSWPAKPGLAHRFEARAGLCQIVIAYDAYERRRP